MPTPYIDRQGLEQRFGTQEIAQLLDDDRSGTEAPGEADSLTRACEDATQLVDGYLATRYTLPLVSVPGLVVGWAADIARFRLWDEQAPEEVRRRYEDALAQLKQLAQGLIGLPPGVEGAAPVSGGDMTGFSAERVFTMDTLKGF
jgi:phage gp36-like protein